MKKMQRAFTLVELMTVVAIMGLLGAASVGGYAAMQRGMRERGAVAAASALLRAAKERAAVDRVPTAVYCYNVMLREKNADADENAVVVGVMTAVRRSGRLTKVAAPLLYDEFGDLNLTYASLSDSKELSSDGKAHSSAELAQRNAMKLYKFPVTETMEYSLVADAVWCTEKNQVHLFSGSATGGDTNCMMSAFYKLNGSKHEASWAVGDAYAFSIGELQLPANMTFGRNAPSSVSEISTPTVILFDPESENDDEVEVCTAVPGVSGTPRFQSAGKATSKEATGDKKE